MKGDVMRHYFVIAGRGDGHTWWLSFPDLPGLYAAADDPGDIRAQVPRSIEDGAMPPADLSEFEDPTIVVVVPYEPATVAKDAA